LLSSVHLESLLSRDIDIEEVYFAVFRYEGTLGVVDGTRIVDTVSLALDLRDGTCEGSPVDSASIIASVWIALAYLL